VKVVSLWRYPIKSHGREQIANVILEPGKPMPWDRLWAVAHEAAKAKSGEWAPCANFSRGSKAPGLMAITASLDETSETITLSHPDLPDLTFRPDDDPEALIAWSTSLVPQDRALPSHVMRLDGRGYTDSDFASVTLCNMASHRAVEAQLGHSLSIYRWRGNIWFESKEPWVEFDWLGSDIQIGDAVLRPRERTDRCLATSANPETGQRDVDTLNALQSFGHKDFSVRAEVIRRGLVSAGDVVKPQ
jgi:MOSC domain-containing protein